MQLPLPPPYEEAVQQPSEAGAACQYQELLELLTRVLGEHPDWPLQRILNLHARFKGDGVTVRVLRNCPDDFLGANNDYATLKGPRSLIRKALADMAP